MARKSKQAKDRELLTIPQCCERLGVSKATFYRYARDWNLECVRLSPRVVRYYADEIDDRIGKATVKQRA